MEGLQWITFFNTLSNLLQQTAFLSMTGGNILMILVACVFLYLAIAKGFEPLLLVPIAFGMLLVNIIQTLSCTRKFKKTGVGGLVTLFLYSR